MRSSRFNIDTHQVRVEGDSLHLDLYGWCFLAFQEADRFEVLHNGKPVKAEITKLRRRDVNRTFPDVDKEDVLGFSIQAVLRPYHSGDTYSVVAYPAESLPGAKALVLWSEKEKDVKRSFLWLAKKAWHKLKSLREQKKEGYERWYEEHRPSARKLQEQRETTFAAAPKISIIVPVYKTPEAFLKQMIGSVQAQTYPNWELCLADGGVDDTVVEKIIRTDYAGEPRIRYQKLTENRGISGNTNAALALATGDWIGLLDHDDLLAPEALFEVVSAINKYSDAEAIYSDEDKVSLDLKKHFEPHFKSDFNPELLRSNNYICHFFVTTKEMMARVGGFRSEFDGSQDHDLILRITEQAKRVVHIPKILYHWRMHQNSTAANPQSKMYAFDAGKAAVQAQLDRLGLDGKVEHTEHLGFYRTTYSLRGEPLVSILIPNKDQIDILRRCIESVQDKTDYPNYEILIIENNSTDPKTFVYYKELETDPRIRVVTWTGKGFNYSAINNFGASLANGSFFLLLNNDIEVIEPGWLTRMVAMCQRDPVGIVGAKLLYPNDTIQHGGVIVGLGGIAGHMFLQKPRDFVGYFARAKLQQNLSAVTAACLLVRAEAFRAVNGLDEAIKVAFNDVDFCLRVREKGWLVVMEPNVLLYHHESVSRGQDDTPAKRKRFESETQYFEKRWHDWLAAGDPYYNPNLSLIATQDFTLKWD